MSFAFLAPQFLWALLALPVVLLLHFIRARKRRYEVSALFLWQQAKEMADTRRRFSPSWLLALQLAFVALAALALAQPNLTLAGRPERVLIIDTSASMGARDSDGVRLDKAIRAANALARRSSQVTVIRAGLDATTLLPLTSDRREVRSALDSLIAVDEEAQLERAVSLAISTAPGAEIHVFTDGEPPAGNQVILNAVGADGLNLGVSTFDIGLQQAFVTVVSNNPRPQQVDLELLQEGRPVAQTNLLVPANGQANVSFPLGESAGFFEARLGAPDWDALALDNSAYAGTRRLQVVLRQGDEDLERALRSVPNINYQVLPSADLDAPGFDVKVLFGTLPEGATGNYLLFSPPANDVVFKTIRSWDRSAELLRFVDLTETVVGLNAGGLAFSEAAYPDWEVLARSGDLSPVILEYRSDDSDLNVIALNVHPSQTDMVNRTAFPLFITNALNSFREEERLRLGEPLAGASSLGQAEVDGVVAVPGLYEREERTFSASLLSASESRLPAFDPVETGPANTPAITTNSIRSIALWLIAIATLLLLGEWLLWSRNQGKWRFGLRN